jgi:hypothetical protein
VPGLLKGDRNIEARQIPTRSKGILPGIANELVSADVIVFAETYMAYKSFNLGSPSSTSPTNLGRGLSCTLMRKGLKVMRTPAGTNPMGNGKSGSLQFSFNVSFKVDF